MTATREHLPGLELALNRWNDGGPAIQYGKLLFDLIEQAQSTSDPAQGEVEIPDIAATFDGLYLVPIQPLKRGDHLMTVAQHNRIMAAAKPDAELVELLCMVRNEWHCVPRDYSQLERIDAKLAAYRT